MEEKFKKLYVDMYPESDPIKPDDFIITIGNKKSNSVYHVVEVRQKERPQNNSIRYYVKVLYSDLPTALQRDHDQQLIPIVWYKRNKK